MGDHCISLNKCPGVYLKIRNLEAFISKFQNRGNNIYIKTKEHPCPVINVVSLLHFNI